jgi:hypothetical protein
VEHEKAELPEDNSLLRSVNCVTRRPGQHDLAAVGGEADPSRYVDGKTNVARIGQQRTSRMQADPDSDARILRPGADENLPLDCDGGVKSRLRLLEDCEQLVGARINLATAWPPNDGAEERPDIGQQFAISVAELAHESGWILDVREKEGDVSGWQCAYLVDTSLNLPANAHVPELARHKADRNDAVLLGGFEQPGACSISCSFVVKGGLVETS